MTKAEKQWKAFSEASKRASISLATWGEYLKALKAAGDKNHFRHHLKG